NGLENVFCTLHINDNDQLTSISTLNNLLSSRGLYINFNPLLIEISLNNLSIPAGYSIDISHCNGLQSINLPNVTILSGISITENPLLTNVVFETLNTLHSSLKIKSNSSLTTLSG